ncbi:hypothetical protein NE237_003904 [Protea cynaroides]|uniref:PRC-barrel domain-containing protein n=1 Tax=Protea cynaroides TaxID=273540 RepID=A0A9Q0KHY7_9MAGN|nr:hypothetical protein NE237_003904 [Protea cynaroides]
MCECVSFTLLTCSGIVTRKLGLVRCDSKLRICRTELLRRIDYGLNSVRLGTRNGERLFAGCGLNRNVGEIDYVSSLNFVRASRSSDALRSGNQDIIDEFGFKEKDRNSFQFETDRRVGEENEEDVCFNPTTANGIGFSDGGMEGDNRRNGSVSSNVDFLELSDLEKGKRTTGRVRSPEGEDVIPNEGSGLTSDKVGRSIGRPEFSSGRQMMRRSSMLAKQVISVQSALSLGFVSQLWVDTCSWMVSMVEVRPSMLSGETERFLLEDVSQVGDVVLVQDESVMENEFKMIGLDTLVGYNVITHNRRNIGKVRGYTFNVNSGAVESLELDSFGISIIPSSLVSTFALFIEDVLEVTSDTVVVYEAAASRIQRLTKGLLDNRNVDVSEDEFGEYAAFDRRSVRVGQHQSSQNNRFPSKMRDLEDDWQLPMDYL